MLMYESFLDFFGKKSSPSIKLAESFVNLFNDIDKNLKCYYEKNGNFIAIYNNSNDRRMLAIEKYKIKTMDLQIYKINLYHYNFDHFNFKELKNIVDFIYDVFDIDIYLHYIYFDIKETDIPNIIEKLTKENYDNFLIKKTSDKFNI